MCNGDRTTQNEFIVKLQNCINAYEEADKQFDEIDDFIQNKMPEETSIIDKEQQDVLHIFEDYDLTDKQIVKLGRHFMKTRETRRNWHNIYEISKVWNEHKNKVINKNNRIFLREIIGKAIKGLDNDWNFRVLKEEDINELLKEDEKVKTTKRKHTGGRKPTPQSKVKKCIEMLNSGMKLKDIAKTLNIGIATVHRIKKANL